MFVNRGPAPHAAPSWAPSARLLRRAGKSERASKNGLIQIFENGENGASKKEELLRDARTARRTHTRRPGELPPKSNRTQHTHEDPGQFRSQTPTQLPRRRGPTGSPALDMPPCGLSLAR